MVDIVTLEEAKGQLQILGADEDDRVQMLIEIATEHVCKILDDANPPPAKPIKGAVLLLIGELDANRTALITGTIVEKNPLFMQMLQPYRKRIGV